MCGSPDKVAAFSKAAVQILPIQFSASDYGIYISPASPSLLRPALLSELPEKAVLIADWNSLIFFLDLPPANGSSSRARLRRGPHGVPDEVALSDRVIGRDEAVYMDSSTARRCNWEFEASGAVAVKQTAYRRSVIKYNKGPHIPEVQTPEIRSAQRAVYSSLLILGVPLSVQKLLQMHLHEIDKTTTDRRQAMLFRPERHAQDLMTGVAHFPRPRDGPLLPVRRSQILRILAATTVDMAAVRKLVEQDDGWSAYLKSAQGCVGTYKSETLTGMVEALVMKEERLKGGKSLRNTKYSSSFDQFCDLVALISMRLSRNILAQIRAKMPAFRPGISALNAGRAAEVLKKLDYTGPLALSWDDTASSLEEAISVHAESEEVCLIPGATDSVIRVTEKDDLDSLFEKA
ncbi:hypothetical protein DFH06DRAFT_1351512 [Mycena polygramma]|nr:hypothetical protein DFH06DRAFT_1351512 [Mycena polygramma]